MKSCLKEKIVLFFGLSLIGMLSFPEWRRPWGHPAFYNLPGIPDDWRRVAGPRDPADDV